MLVKIVFELVLLATSVSTVLEFHVWLSSISVHAVGQARWGIIPGSTFSIMFRSFLSSTFRFSSSFVSKTPRSLSCGIEGSSQPYRGVQPFVSSKLEYGLPNLFTDLAPPPAATKVFNEEPTPWFSSTSSSAPSPASMATAALRLSLYPTSFRSSAASSESSSDTASLLLTALTNVPRFIAGGIARPSAVSLLVLFGLAMKEPTPSSITAGKPMNESSAPAKFADPPRAKRKNWSAALKSCVTFGPMSRDDAVDDLLAVSLVLTGDV
mmetsp:Transcript_30666/g.72989  ORF Transcript_30666/g.72989 Transcript_30666/m.72989 type:complete len:267 (+) Transcript_30666:1445-2245(+)